MSFYHSLSNPQHNVSLYNIYRDIKNARSGHTRSGREDYISRIQRNILRYSSSGIPDTGILPDTSELLELSQKNEIFDSLTRPNVPPRTNDY